MKIFIKIFLLTIFLASNITNSYAMLGEEEEREVRYIDINVTGYRNYPPFGENTEDKVFESMLDGFLLDFKKDKEFDITYKMRGKYSEAVQNVRTGNIDLIIGIYNATNIYNGIEFIFPAAITNPIHIITLPNRTKEIEQLEDVKGLKGAIHANEHYSDYVAKQLNNFNIEKIDNSYELFEKLFKGEIDYFFSSRYFTMIEASKLGITNKISYSKKPIWSMPMFFGISKSYKYRRNVTEYIGKELKKPEVKEKINNYLIEMINNIERENVGIVPPTFVTEQK